MDDQKIRSEVLEAEAVIRGLAQRMQLSEAALETAESARRNLESVAASLQHHLADADSVGQKIQAATDRAEQATLQLLENGKVVFASAAVELKQEAEGLRALHSSLDESVKELLESGRLTVARTDESVAELEQRIREALSAAQTAGDKLTDRLALASQTGVQTLISEFQTLRGVSDKLVSQVDFTRNELHSQITSTHETMAELRKQQQAIIGFLEAMNNGLSTRMQEARVKSATQLTEIEEEMETRHKSISRRLTGGLIVQVLTLLAAAAATAVSVKLMMH